ncbi:MAG: hypothetical protein JJ714_00155 [Acidithiobacillus sp.]|nr:hypothetical protein [Acidithiobacillus sp.]
MPHKLLIANLGSSDVQPARSGMWPDWDALWSPPQGIPTQPAAKNRVNFRAIGEFLYNCDTRKIKELYREVSGLTLPLLESYIEYLNPVSRLVLFGTDQVEEEHRTGDTYPLAKAIKKHASILLPRVGKIDIFPLQGSPVDPISLASQYRERLKGVERSLEEDWEIWVALTGGTQQMNSMLMLESVLSFPKEYPLTFVYKPNDGEPSSVPLVSHFQQLFFVREMKALTKSYAFKVVAELIQQHERPICRAIKSLAMYGHYRLNSNWPDAASMLEQALQMANALNPEDRARVESWRKELLRRTESAQTLPELLFQAHVMLDQGNLWSFVLRLATAREQALAHIARLCDVPFNEYIDSQWLQNHPSVYQKLQGLRVEPRANTRVLLAIDEEVAPPHLQDAVSYLKALEAVQSLRNKVIHEGKPLDDKALSQIVAKVNQDLGLSPDDPLAISHHQELLTRFFKYAYAIAELPNTVTVNPYEELKQLLDRLLDKLRED